MVHKVLTSTEITRFQENGFLSPIKILEEKKAASYRSRLEKFEKNYPKLQGKLDFKANLICSWVDQLAREKHLLDIVEDLIGPNILNWNATFRIKESNGQAHADWHQDSMYIKLEPFLLIVWLALSPANERNGCLRLIPGSHKWPLLPHREGKDKNSILSRAQFIEYPLNSSASISAELKLGEACIFNHKIVHSSGVNVSGNRRIGLLIDYIPTSAVKGGPRDSAMLVRGRDDVGHFILETPPSGEATPQNLSNQREALKLMTATTYNQSSYTPKGLS